MKVIRVSWNEWFCTGTLSIKPGKLIIFSSIKFTTLKSIIVGIKYLYKTETRYGRNTIMGRNQIEPIWKAEMHCNFLRLRY